LRSTALKPVGGSASPQVAARGVQGKTGAPTATPMDAFDAYCAGNEVNDTLVEVGQELIDEG